MNQTTIFLEDLTFAAIALLREHEPPEGYYGGFSGGKDSCVIKELARLANVRVEWHYHMGIDPPEVVRFIREAHPDVIIDRPTVHIFRKVRVNGMPWRTMRWCCALIKEKRGAGRVRLLGVRAAESPRRAALWAEFDGNSIAPILSWSDDDVWSFIRARAVPYCGLYNEGFARLGCVGCPLAGQASRDRDFARWPRFERAWKRACMDRAAYLLGKDGHLKPWDTPEEMWAWWRYQIGQSAQPEPQCGEQEVMRFQQ
jgi:phosphoadenosine phosphosulfate reductase